ncbi:MAG: hypothetical protein GC189_02360 [Alphaproteobacteria bacterium]|nr:hypothetical protein [Alphaproteobacteria bacterium]
MINHNNNEMPERRASPGVRLAAVFLAAAALTNCTSFPRMRAEPQTGSPAAEDGETQTQARRGTVVRLDPPPAPVRPATQRQDALSNAEIDLIPEDRLVDVSFPPQPLPQFIDTVFGQALGIPYFTGPGVAQRSDIVSLRGAGQTSARRLYVMAEMALRQYGLVVIAERGGVRIMQDAVASGQAPSFSRGRAIEDAPSGRRLTHFFAASTLDAQALVDVLQGVYSAAGGVSMRADAQSNMVIFTGPGREVAAASAIAAEIDQPRFANARIARIDPVFMSAEQLAHALTQTLTAEGYQISNLAEGRDRAISVFAPQFSNQVLVFSLDAAGFDRAVYWAGQLDDPAALSEGDGVFVYEARHTRAEELGALAAGFGGAGQAGGGPLPPEEGVRRIDGVRASDRARAAPGATSYGALTVDRAGNRILFRGPAREFARLRALLEQLDTPPRQVLVEMTIAEVTLSDETRFGVEWFFEDILADGSITGSTLGGSTRQAGGLGVTAARVFSSSRVQAALNAFASNRNLNILSTPRLVTRSGGEAEILIGTDVPIITSQRASDSQTSGDTDILQTVQYRQTGVILNVRPVVYGEDRIDIELYQEVSSQQPNTTAAISSPLILNRSVTTQIALQEGMTAVIGGIIQDNYSRDQRGVPLLKDIPVVGGAFRSDQVSGDKVELLILITPYIVRESADMTAFAQDMAATVNTTLRTRGPQTYTLYPWRSPFARPRGWLARAANAAEGDAGAAPGALNEGAESDSQPEQAAPDAQPDPIQPPVPPEPMALTPGESP